MASTDLLSCAICVPNRPPFSPHIFFQTNRWHILLQPLDWTCMHHEACCSKWSALYIRVELVMYICAICHLYVWVVPIIYKCFRAHSVPIFLEKNVRTRTDGIPFWKRLVFWSSVCTPSDGIFGSLRKYWTEICHLRRWGFMPSTCDWVYILDWQSFSSESLSTPKALRTRQARSPVRSFPGHDNPSYHPFFQGWFTWIIHC